MWKTGILICLGWIIFVTGCSSQPSASKGRDGLPPRTVKYSGLRSSSYGVEPFPLKEGWEYAMDKMQGYFPGSEACGIWIIGNVENGGCLLQFPQEEEGNSYEKIQFYDYDKHEEYLDYFDEVGIKVFLQVESGQADMTDLIDLVLSRYGHHPCVVGFGVDLEWYDPLGQGGINGEDFFTALSSETAMEWDRRVKSYHPDYRLFLKHWISGEEIMPQETTGDILFISDSQGFYGQAHEDPDLALDYMVEEFSQYWAANFRKGDNIRPVGFQIGYDSDSGFWETILDAPYPQSLGNAILESIPQEQEVSFFWVDFTMYDVFLQDYQGDNPLVASIPLDLPELGENYAYNATVKVSTVESVRTLGGERMVDNDLNTRWASDIGDNEWAELDLHETRGIRTIVLYWEYAHAVKYRILVSEDGIDWVEVFNEEAGDGDQDVISLNTQAQYIRLETRQRATEWGNSLYEIGIFGK